MKLLRSLIEKKDEHPTTGKSGLEGNKLTKPTEGNDTEAYLTVLGKKTVCTPLCHILLDVCCIILVGIGCSVSGHVLF